MADWFLNGTAPFGALLVQIPPAFSPLTRMVTTL